MLFPRVSLTFSRRGSIIFLSRCAGVLPANSPQRKGGFMLKRLIPLLLAGAMLAACGSAEPTKSSTLQFFAMDTYMTLTVYGEGCDEAAAAARDEIYRLEEILSKTEETSDISRLNRGEALESLSPDGQEAVEEALARRQETGGAYDPTLYDLVELWGIGTDHARVPAEEEIAEALSRRERYDLGGIGKGFATDKVVQLLRGLGVESANLSLGGNVYVMGSNPEDGDPWRVGLKDPEDEQQIVGYLDLEDQSVVTSGDYERYFEENGRRYHHIFDPQTGWPADQGLESVTIISADSSMADCYSTALFVMGLEEGLAFCEGREDFGAIFITSDREVFVTENLRDQFVLTAEDRGYHYG